jgi:hypothetical protein
MDVQMYSMFFQIMGMPEFKSYKTKKHGYKGFYVGAALAAIKIGQSFF